MGIGTIVFGIISISGLIFVGRLLVMGLLSRRIVAFHYRGHISKWNENRFGYVTIFVYNMFWFVLSAALFTATILGRFN